jgi:hypothetical protein
MVNFYSTFIPSSSMLLKPLYFLLEWAVPWMWESPQEDTFRKCIQVLGHDLVLVSYSLDLPVWLTCDASHVRAGAVLSHIMPDAETHIGKRVW